MQAVNGLGPSAYIGAGAYLSSKLLLTEGAAIGNVESRHNSWLNGLIGRSEQPSKSDGHTILCQPADVLSV